MKSKHEPTAEQLHGSLQKIIYYNNENGYLIGSVLNGKGSSTVVGYLHAPHEGDEFLFNGVWVNHAKYGRQFKFSSYETKLPTSLAGIEHYLSSGLIKGIGPAFAERIVHRFGTSTLDILSHHPERLLEIDGIGQKKYTAILSALESLKEMQEVMVYLKSLNIATYQAVKLYKTYEKHTAAVLKENPYQIIDDVAGIGFQTADEIAKKVGVSHDSLYRLSSGVRYILDDACRSGGHCFLPAEELIRRAAELLTVDETKIESALNNAVAQGFLVEESNNIFPLKLFEAEDSSVRKIELLTRKHANPFTQEKLLNELKKIERFHDLEFDPKQREAILHAVTHSITILTGGPGTGKTLCVNGIIELADLLGLSYLLCAPTGRAAKRLAEVSKREAKTIHRLLEYDPMQNTFRRGEDSPLECNIIIVDEVSMVDIQLFEALLNAVSPESQLVLVGDVDQLPSVGPGQVLRDLIESKRIPTIRLATIFRQMHGSSIITNSHRINHGDAPEFTEEFQFIDADTPEKIREVIVQQCSTILPQNEQYNPFSDIQVLSPRNDGIGGVKDLNKELQHILNGTSRICWQGNERKFIMGDKVMQIRNNYDKDIFNGDIGRVAGVEKEAGKLIVDFYGKFVEYSFDQMDELVLAYATTIHKSQGNEFKAVIIPMTMSHYIMLQRNLLYTAVTRAKERLIIVGQKKALAVALNNIDVRERNTLLKKRLQKIL
ncbi:MAG: ATP-dependent RecD-like DNA helicase [Bacteroidetes bacterium]|nr:ATP-dependent RecD-like DNA helicase [Bacteroidota bacterium]